MAIKIYQKQNIKEIDKILSNGGIVAVPTDTVYGLAIDAQNELAFSKLMKIKSRDINSQFILVVSSIEKLKEIVLISKSEEKLISKFSPGPITFVFNKKKEFVINNICDYQKLAIRIPDNNFLIELMNFNNRMLFLPSANPKSLNPSLNKEEVINYFTEEEVDGVVEGSSDQLNVSTILDMTTSEYKVLREGLISKEEILRFLRSEKHD